VLRDDSDPTDPEIVDRFDGGTGWIPHPHEGMRRASHLLVGAGSDSTDEDAAAEGSVDDQRASESESEAAPVWLVDPLDAPGVDDRCAEYGDVAGVVVLLDRHTRDATAIARRHDVPVYLPTSVEAEGDLGDVPVERVTGRLADSGFEVRTVVDWPGWHETALYDGETLVVGDALGTAGYYTASSERLGVHPALRPAPPQSLRNLSPERILVGHGEGVMVGGEEALETALSGARRRLPEAWLTAPRAFL
jgi:hypothetical protein